MEIRFYDRELNFLGLTENQSSLLWRRKYWESGEFELHLPVGDNSVRLCQKGNIVSYVGAKEAGVIEDILISENIDLTEIVVKGRFLSSYMDRRLILGTVNYSGRVEDAMRQLVSNATPIPLLELGEIADLPNTVTFQATFRNLLAYETKLAYTSGYGFRFRPDFTEKKIYFEVYSGVDRSKGNGSRSFVEFSDDFDNINSASYQYNDQLYKNVAYIGGEGEGQDRKFIVVGDNTLAGLDRREVFIDARDVRSDNLTETAYEQALAQDGYEKLAEEYVESETFECEVNPMSNFVYRTDYDLGDIVTVRKSNWGTSANLRITEVLEVYEDGAFNIVPTIGESIPTGMEKEDSSDDDFHVAVKDLQYKTVSLNQDTDGRFLIIESQNGLSSEVGEDVPASGNYIMNGISFNDINGQSVASVNVRKNSADMVYTLLQTGRLLNGDPVYHSMYVGIKADGTNQVGLDKTAWRNALGLGNAIIQSQVDSKSVPTAKDTNLASVSLPAGVYVVQGATSIASNTTGRREIHFTTTSGGTAASGGRYASSGSINANTGITYQNFTAIFSFSATTTLYLVAYQNSGSSLSYTSIGIRAFKIG